jgi:hypothetical protein
MNSPIIPAFFILGFFALILVAFVFAILKARAADKKLAEIFENLKLRKGFEEVSQGSQEMAEFKEKFDSFHKSGISSISLGGGKALRCLRKTEDSVHAYIARILPEKISSRSSQRVENLVFFREHNLGILGRIFIRPRFAGFAEKIIGGMLSLAIGMQGNIIADPDPELSGQYAVYLLDSSVQDCKRILNSEVKEILLKRASQYPLVLRGQECPGIQITGSALLINGEKTGEENEIENLLALGFDLSRKLEEIEPVGKSTSFNQEGSPLEGAQEGETAGDDVGMEKDGDEIIKFDI